MADWSSLSHDLLRKISGSFLATQDLDYYTDFRFVCRQATAKPTLDGTDQRFTASNWMMLDREKEDNFLSFVNLATGRFLRGFFFVGAATGSGLLVLGERAPPHQTHVLNPFTGAMACFRAPIPVEKVCAVVVAITSSSPVTVFVLSMCGYMVSWIDQSSESFERAEFRTEDWRMYSHMTLFDGAVHLNSQSGSIISSTSRGAATDANAAIAVVGEEGGARDQVAFDEQQRRTITMSTAIVSPSSGEVTYCYYLVEFQGELLLVRAGHYFEDPVVYRVDMVNKGLVPVKSIGGCALFVSYFRCFSVDASKFDTVQDGTIYRVSYDGVVSYDYEGLTRRCRWRVPVVDLRTECLHCCCRPLALPEFFASYRIGDVDQLSEPEMMMRYGVVE